MEVVINLLGMSSREKLEHTLPNDIPWRARTSRRALGDRPTAGTNNGCSETYWLMALTISVLQVGLQWTGASRPLPSWDPGSIASESFEYNYNRDTARVDSLGVYPIADRTSRGMPLSWAIILPEWEEIQKIPDFGVRHTPIHEFRWDFQSADL